MVKEHRYVFDVSDIASLLYVCLMCGEEAACKLDGEFQPIKCSSCGAPLFAEDSFHENNPNNPNYTVLRELRRIQKVTNPRVQLRFVVSDPDNPVKSTE